MGRKGSDQKKGLVPYTGNTGDGCAKAVDDGYYVALNGEPAKGYQAQAQGPQYNWKQEQPSNFANASSWQAPPIYQGQQVPPNVQRREDGSPWQPPVNSQGYQQGLHTNMQSQQGHVVPQPPQGYNPNWQGSQKQGYVQNGQGGQLVQGYPPEPYCPQHGYQNNQCQVDHAREQEERRKRTCIAAFAAGLIACWACTWPCHGPCLCGL